MIEAILGIFFGTFVLEDAALALAISLCNQGKVSFLFAFLAAFLGISLGDLGLYALGALAARFGIGENSRWVVRARKFVSGKSLGLWIVLARGIPGSRLPMYIGAGYLSYSFLNFFLLTLISVFVWVAFAMGVGGGLFFLFQGRTLLPLILFFLVLCIGKGAFSVLTQKWERKAFLHSWRKWSSFEFWPAWFFYPPVLIYYLWLSIKYGSPVYPLYSNPGIPHGGLLGESKWDFLRFLSKNPAALKTFFLPEGDQRKSLEGLLQRGDISYPFVLKPDVGQRGFGVRLIRNPEERDHYLAEVDFPLLAQEFCGWEREAGIFYYRFPESDRGTIFSITDKAFPAVFGDGKTALGDLILADRRARILASTYFSRFTEELDRVPEPGEKIPLAKFGNHCQGAIFLNGQRMISPHLVEALDKVAKEIPGFFMGRFDLRFSSEEELMAGKNFKILELNGAGSEATHIWDPKTNLLEAYLVLFEQWRIFFALGKQVEEKNMVKFPLDLRKLVSDWFRFRNKNRNLSVSS